MITRRFAFGDLYVNVSEQCETNFSKYTWPCAVVLAHYVWRNKNAFNGMNCIELGSGTGLVGLLTAAINKNGTTLLTDKEPLTFNFPQGSSCETTTLVWGNKQEIEKVKRMIPKIDVILGADVFYEPALFEPLIATVAELLSGNDAKFITAYEERSAKRNINHLLERYGLFGEVIDVEDIKSELNMQFNGLNSVYCFKISRC